MGVLCLILVLLFSTLCPSSFAISMIEKRERAGCFTLTVFLVYYDIQCSMALPQLQGGRHNSGMQCMIAVFPDHTYFFFV